MTLSISAPVKVAFSGGMGREDRTVRADCDWKERRDRVER